MLSILESEHEELNEKDDAFVSVEAEAEADVEAGDESVLHSIIEDEDAEGTNPEAAMLKY